jgi:hypothetical protein
MKLLKTLAITFALLVPVAAVAAPAVATATGCCPCCPPGNGG